MKSMKLNNRYRKKPVEVEAFYFDGYNGWLIQQWSDGKVIVSSEESISDGSITNYLIIQTLEGVMTANKGDWIIKGVAGEFYPCKSEIFEKTYESVD